VWHGGNSIYLNY